MATIIRGIEAKHYTPLTKKLSADVKESLSRSICNVIDKNYF
jgi:hypothetical protein